MKRSDTCSCFLEIWYQIFSHQLNEPKTAGGHVVRVPAANQIILFIFARAIYDAFNYISMVTVMLYRWPYNNCTFVPATVSNNNDIGTIEVDAYINTRRAQVDAIQTINSDEIAALMWFQPHRMAIAVHSRRQVYRHDTLSTIFMKFGFQKSVSARQLLWLDRFTWTINQLGIVERIHPC